jgi:hypothetical protein
MRGAFGLIGLLLALAVVGVVVKKQLAAVPAPVLPAQPSASAAGEPVAPVGNAVGQSRQVQEQFRQALDGAMQQARPLQDEK